MLSVLLAFRLKIKRPRALPATLHFDAKGTTRATNASLYYHKASPASSGFGIPAANGWLVLPAGALGLAGLLGVGSFSAVSISFRTGQSSVVYMLVYSAKCYKSQAFNHKAMISVGFSTKILTILWKSLTAQVVLAPGETLRSSLWRRQSHSLHLRLKTNPLMTAVAERFVLGMPASAQTDRRPASEVERSALGITKAELALKPQRTIISNRNLGHANPPCDRA